MKKFLIPVLLVAFSSSVFAEDKTPSKPWSESASDFVYNWTPACVYDARVSVEKTIAAHPWYSAAAVAVATVLVVKAVEFACAKNADEETGF